MAGSTCRVGHFCAYRGWLLSGK